MSGSGRRRSRKVRADDPETWAGPAVGLLVAIAIAWTFVIAPALRWVQDNAILVTVVGVLVSGPLAWFGYQHLTERRRLAESLPGRIVTAIKRFEPSRKYGNEFGYHTELQGWLKREFPSAVVELQTGSSRPDIVVDGVAIEVKGPTDGAGLKTLGDKCVRYLQHHQSLVIVLFEPRYGRRLYNEVESGITRMFPGKAWLIEK